jgi:hypothetical protein
MEGPWGVPDGWVNFRTLVSVRGPKTSGKPPYAAFPAKPITQPHPKANARELPLNSRGLKQLKERKQKGWDREGGDRYHKETEKPRNCW